VHMVVAIAAGQRAKPLSFFQWLHELQIPSEAEQAFRLKPNTDSD
jgi:hypothetical protein